MENKEQLRPLTREELKFSEENYHLIMDFMMKSKLDAEEFFDIVDLLKREYPKMQIDGRLPSKLQTRLMLSPQGELYRMIGENDDENRVYGNILTKKINIGAIYKKDKCN